MFLPCKVRSSIITLGIFLGWSCVSASKMNSEMESWTGRSKDDVLAHYGGPNSSSKLSDGREVLTFGKRCDVIFTVSPEAKVISGVWKGNKYLCRKEMLPPPSPR